MKIKLLNFTREAEKTCAVAARLCYSSCNVNKIYKQLSKDKIKKILKKVISMEHYSVLEHAFFTFCIENVSRSLLAQFTRHRIASFSVQSQRYVNMLKSTDIKFIIPESIKNNEFLLKKCNDIFKNIELLYRELLDAGISIEDSRCILPNAFQTKLIVTMNARELRHFFSLRCCNKSQEEIRLMACRMLDIVKKKFFLLFYNAGPKCVRGKCEEIFKCKHHWEKDVY
ncbi:MAG: FAD-dependent thymidylate synthase [Endomicrobium sp.]|jgi:thymidylate synthase (FAD)|nr:FAD-dependent thymidylate synthase [Endomicrobium sp.]